MFLSQFLICIISGVVLHFHLKSDFKQALIWLQWLPNLFRSAPLREILDNSRIKLRECGLLLYDWFNSLMNSFVASLLSSRWNSDVWSSCSLLSKWSMPSAANNCVVCILGGNPSASFMLFPSNVDIWSFSFTSNDRFSNPYMSTGRTYVLYSWPITNECVCLSKPISFSFSKAKLAAWTLCVMWESFLVLFWI